MMMKMKKKEKKEMTTMMGTTMIMDGQAWTETRSRECDGDEGHIRGKADTFVRQAGRKAARPKYFVPFAYLFRA